MIMVPMVIGRWLDIIGWLSGGVCSLDQLTRLLLLFINLVQGMSAEIL